MNKRKYNRLINEKSPYLQHHATNPVDWYPWGQEAFETAKREDKPIFLSIGYLCLSLVPRDGKESFEDKQVADLLNNNFICVKVGPEKRPDIDKTYMAIAQILANTSGWPLTIVMTPERKPFFASTYIPKHDAYGRVGMVKLLPRIREIWDTRREEVLKSSDKITTSLQKASRYQNRAELDDSIFEQGFSQLGRFYDQRIWWIR
ncbi:MAG: thioredoxin domain-containing protein [Actinomycetota bacterium]|nr:thioredoxin domain-containing protein [Actinomycetota bacterium]